MSRGENENILLVEQTQGSLLYTMQFHFKFSYFNKIYRFNGQLPVLTYHKETILFFTYLFKYTRLSWTMFKVCDEIK